jgi:hypothetical protein
MPFPARPYIFDYRNNSLYEKHKASNLNITQFSSTFGYYEGSRLLVGFMRARRINTHVQNFD